MPTEQRPRGDRHKETKQDIRVLSQLGPEMPSEQAWGGTDTKKQNKISETSTIWRQQIFRNLPKSHVIKIFTQKLSDAQK